MLLYISLPTPLFSPVGSSLNKMRYYHELVPFIYILSMQPSMYYFSIVLSIHILYVLIYVYFIYVWSHPSIFYQSMFPSIHYSVYFIYGPLYLLEGAQLTRTSVISFILYVYNTFQYVYICVFIYIYVTAEMDISAGMD